MNAHFFSVKRAHYAVLRVLRKPLKSFGLTSARYDLLHLLFGNGDEDSRWSWFKQSEIWRALGVCKSVASRMLKSLEKLGLVERFRSVADKRRKSVKLTPRGLDCVREARQCLRRAAWRLLVGAICIDVLRDKDKTFGRLCLFEACLYVMRRHYGDTALLHIYPWHPDD